jgi:PAS domain S-box-containing protein
MLQLLSSDLHFSGFQRTIQNFRDQKSLEKVARDNRFGKKLTREATEKLANQFVVLFTSTDQTIQWVSHSFTEMTGYLPHEVVGSTPKMFQGPKTQRNELNKIKQAMKEHRPVQTELINYRKDGSLYMCEISIQEVRSRDFVCRGYLAYERSIGIA